MVYENESKNCNDIDTFRLVLLFILITFYTRFQELVQQFDTYLVILALGTKLESSMRRNQTPSIYSIYNNALPYYMDRVDITTLTEEGADYSKRFIQLLFDYNLNEQVDSSSLIADRIKHLYFETRNLSKVAGTRTFGFGFPLIIDTFEGELVAAPLFVWNINIEPALGKSDAWVFKFDSTGHFSPNFQLTKFLEEKYGYDYTAHLERLVDFVKFDSEKLKQLCVEMSQRFHFDQTIDSFEQVEEAPGIDEIGTLTNKGAIRWSGILGVFPPQNTTWQPGNKKPEDVFVPQALELANDSCIYPFISTNPELATATETVLRNRMAVIECQDVSSQQVVLLNLLITQLVQGRKCLVVSESAPSLKKYIDKLSQLGISNLHYLLTDSRYDGPQFLEMLKITAKGIGKGIEYDPNDFQFKKNQYLRDKKTLDGAYSAIQSKVFGDYNWKDVVGLFVSSHFKEKKELLATHLNKNDYDFTVVEYDAIKKGIEISFPLFQEVKTLNHPLSNLNDVVFQQVSAEDGRNFVNEQITHFQKKASHLLYDYISGLDNYKSQLNEHFSIKAFRLTTSLKAIQEKIDGFKDQLGDEFVDSGSSLFSIPLFYGKKKKRIVAAQKQIAKMYNEFLKQFHESKLFDHEFKSSKSISVEEIISNLKSFKSSYLQWENSLEALIQEETIRLNSRTAHPALGIKEDVTTLEFELESFIDELNDASLYSFPFENKTLTIIQRQKYLETIIEQLEKTHLNLRDFPTFYLWQSNWISLGETGQKVIKALVKVKPSNWVAAFESWYFHHLLQSNLPEGLPGNDEIFEKYYTSWHALKPLIFNHIFKHWQLNQQKSLRSLKKQNKAVYKELFETGFSKKNKSKPLEELFLEGFNAVTDCFPLLFVSPHAALNLVPKDFKYDMVVFDVANRFSIEQGTEIAQLGNQIALFGTNLTFGNETSLLQYALENDIPSVKLVNEYLSNREFRNESEFGTIKYKVDSLDGRFHEVDNTNDIEAQYIIRLLNQIKQTPQRVYPSVGIIAFTKEQRDLIASYFLKLKQQNNVASEKIKQLERNGMGVFYAEEVFGQEFDIIVVSCTFGTVSTKGKMTKRMSILDTPEGVSFIKMLAQKRANEFHIIHSFSNQQLTKIQGKNWENGVWLLSQLIELGEAYQNGNPSVYNNCRETLCLFEIGKSYSSLLAEAISKKLKAYVEEESIQINQEFEGLNIPILISGSGSQNHQGIVVIPDGFLSNAEFTSGIWEFEQKKIVVESGFQLISSWSSDWQRNPERELRKLASLIINVEKQVQQEVQDGKLINKTSSLLNSNEDEI